ncbi:hypothetical protein LPB03_11870 [Polaribacter vadi]|uniref:Uncharacterized protein n=2 Tax=Polaribacter vadi TaxID=1774273 RepID=A0A1B8TU85_9FLAO|nr:hypothetical protein [Polaribacter vadi]AOW18107.1 hypothetical protein LPB03_11870 [Polaribacter vadi]OBY63152.1 hypothetical protein LPB3_11880 [Polaribacter vadi]
MNLKRACIYPKDIQRITGRSERYGRKLLQEIKDFLGKESYQFITINEFSEYSGIQIDIVKEYIEN